MLLVLGCLLSVLVRVELIKIIRQFTNAKYKMDNHRPHWLKETHRLYFYLLTPDMKNQTKLVLIDQRDKNRAVDDRTVPVLPYVTTAVHPWTAGASGPIGQVIRAGEGGSGDAGMNDNEIGPDKSIARADGLPDAEQVATAASAAAAAAARAGAAGAEDGTDVDAVAADASAAAAVPAASASGE